MTLTRLFTLALSDEIIDVEGFLQGVQTDSEGDTEQYSSEDIDEMVASFDPQRPPRLTIGHVGPGAPAYGWGVRIKRVGDKIITGLGKLRNEVVDWLKHYHYNQVSIEVFDRDHPANPTPGLLNIYRIALLGAEPPAIPGLEPIQKYSAGLDKLKVYSFSVARSDELGAANDYAAEPNKTVSEVDMDESIIEDLKARLEALEGKADMAAPTEEEDKEEQEQANYMAPSSFVDELIKRLTGGDMTALSEATGVPTDQINAAIGGASELTPEQNTALVDALMAMSSPADFTAPEQTEPENTMDNKEFAALEAKFAAQEKKLAQQQQQLTSFSAQIIKDQETLEDTKRRLDEREAAIEKSEISAFAAQLVKDLKIRPDEKEGVVEEILAYDNTSTLNFSASEGGEKLTPRQGVMRNYRSRPRLVPEYEFNEPAPKGSNGNKPLLRRPRGYSAAPKAEEAALKVAAYAAEHGVGVLEANRKFKNGEI